MKFLLLLIPLIGCNGGQQLPEPGTPPKHVHKVELSNTVKIDNVTRIYYVCSCGDTLIVYKDTKSITTEKE